MSMQLLMNQGKLKVFL